MVARATRSSAGRAPSSRACERGQFATTVRAARCGATLLPIARWLAPFTDRIVLALELAGPRAAEIHQGITALPPSVAPAKNHIRLKVEKQP